MLYTCNARPCVLLPARPQVFSAISPSNRTDFQRAVHGSSVPNVVIMLEENGFTLEQHMPEGKPAVLVTFPPEHISHIVWQVRVYPTIMPLGLPRTCC